MGSFPRAQGLQKLASFVVEPVRRDASDAVENEADVAKEGLTGGVGGEEASTKLITLLGIDGIVRALSSSGSSGSSLTRQQLDE